MPITNIENCLGFLFHLLPYIGIIFLKFTSFYYIYVNFPLAIWPVTRYVTFAQPAKFFLPQHLLYRKKSTEHIWNNYTWMELKFSTHLILAHCLELNEIYVPIFY
jgi:hypothetical protein